MPGFNPENINIHDLTIEEPEKEASLAFDPERDISQENWENLRNDFQEFLKKIKNPYDEDHDQVDFSIGVEMAMNMKILDPEIVIDPKIIKDIAEVMIEDESLDFWATALETATRLSVINPTQKFHFDNETIEACEKSIDKQRDGSGYDLSFVAVTAKMLHLDAEILKEDLETMQMYLFGLKSQGQWMNFMKLAANIKILEPGVKLSLDDDAWANMLKELNSHSADSLEFASQAAAMKILAAEDVYVPDDRCGLVVNMHKPQEHYSESSSLPEQRKF